MHLWITASFKYQHHSGRSYCKIVCQFVFSRFMALSEYSGFFTIQQNLHFSASKRILSIKHHINPLFPTLDVRFIVRFLVLPIACKKSVILSEYSGFLHHPRTQNTLVNVKASWDSWLQECKTPLYFILAVRFVQPNS